MKNNKEYSNSCLIFLITLGLQMQMTIGSRSQAPYFEVQLHELKVITIKFYEDPDEDSGPGVSIGKICSNGITDQGCQVLCRQASKSGGILVPSVNNSTHNETDFWLELNCTGYEADMSQCHINVFSNFSKCMHNDSLGQHAVCQCDGQQYIGCYIDDNNDKDFIHKHNTTVGKNSKCRRYCMDENFKFAATQFGGECFCGNKYGKHGKASNDSECNMNCTDGGLRNCGGQNRSSVFAIKSFDNFTVSLSNGYRGEINIIRHRNQNNFYICGGNQSQNAKEWDQNNCFVLCKELGFIYSTSQEYFKGSIKPNISCDKNASSLTECLNNAKDLFKESDKEKCNLTLECTCQMPNLGSWILPGYQLNETGSNILDTNNTFQASSLKDCINHAANSTFVAYDISQGNCTHSNDDVNMIQLMNMLMADDHTALKLKRKGGLLNDDRDSKVSSDTTTTVLDSTTAVSPENAQFQGFTLKAENKTCEDELKPFSASLPECHEKCELESKCRLFIYDIIKEECKTSEDPECVLKNYNGGYVFVKSNLKRDNTLMIIVICVVVIVAALLICAVVTILCCCFKRKVHKMENVYKNQQLKRAENHYHHGGNDISVYDEPDEKYEEIPADHQPQQSEYNHIYEDNSNTDKSKWPQVFTMSVNLMELLKKNKP